MVIKTAYEVRFLVGKKKKSLNCDDAGEVVYISGKEYSQASSEIHRVGSRVDLPADPSEKFLLNGYLFRLIKNEPKEIQVFVEDRTKRRMDLVVLLDELNLPWPVHF